MNRRKFLKTCGIGLGALYFAPKVFFETKECNPVKLYYECREEYRKLLGEWMRDKMDEDIFNILTNSPTKAYYSK